MQLVTLFTLASAALLARVGAQSSTVNGTATPVTNYPGATYTAVLPATGSPQGSVSLTAAPNGIGALVQVSFYNFPAQGGPFLYHIHVSPVDSTGNCLSAGAHLDPFNRGETPPCDPTQPQTCQVGDLSGKNGQITTDPFTASYVDPYISLVPGQPAFAGNRSVVVHLHNKTRITCGNFAIVPSSNSSNSTGVSTTSSPYAQYTGAATSTVAPLLSVVAIAAAALFL